MGRTPPRVVVTGGIGSGKSLVCSLLADLGVIVVDADRLGHAVLDPGGEAFAQVATRWPQTVEDGRIVRARLGGIVFSDPAQLAELVAITHPHIRSRMLAEVEHHADRPVAVEISAPSDQVMPPWPVLVVDAGPRTIDRRLRLRGMSEADIAARKASQPSRTEWRRMADHVIRNDGNRNALDEEVSEAAARMGLLSR